MTSQLENVTVDTKTPVEIYNFSNDELERFKLIKSYYPEFKYSETFINTSESNQKMIYNKIDNLYFGIYVTYDVTYFDEGFINYFFDAGTAFKGYGSYFVIDDNTVIKTEKTSGTGAYTYEIYKNGKIIDSDTIQYEN